MSSNVKTGHNIGLCIMQGNTYDADVGITKPILGTEKQGTIPGVIASLKAKMRVIGGSPSITYPVDNDPQETTELGTRTIQKWTGAEKIDGKLERWMIDSDLLGAVRGKAAYAASSNTYSRADEFVKFNIYIFHMDTSEGLVTALDNKDPASVTTGYSYKVKLTGVTFGNYDAPSEANARQKESVSYSAETMEIEALA